MNQPSPIPPRLRAAIAVWAAVVRELHEETCAMYPEIDYHLRLAITAADVPCSAMQVQMALEMGREVIEAFDTTEEAANAE